MKNKEIFANEKKLLGPDISDTHTDTHTLLLSNDEGRLSLGLGDVSVNQSVNASADDLIFLLINNQGDEIIKQIDSVVQIANQKLSIYSLEVKQMNNESKAEVNVYTTHHNSEQQYFIEKFDKFLEHLHGRVGEIIEQGSSKVFRPLVQMMNLLDEKTISFEQRKEIQRRITEIICDLIPMKSPIVHKILIENCIPTFPPEHLNKLIIKYIKSIDNRIGSLNGVTILHKVAKYFEDIQLDDEFREEMSFKQVLIAIDEKFKYISLLGHGDLWIEALIQFGTKLQYDIDIFKEYRAELSEELQLKMVGISKQIELNIKVKEEYDEQNHAIIIRKNTVLYGNNLIIHRPEKLLKKLIDNTTLIDNEKSVLNEMVYFLFLDIKEPPSHELGKYKKNQIFSSLEMRKVTNQLLESMIADIELYRYQVSALLSIFPLQYLNNKNRKMLTLSDVRNPIYLRHGFESNYLCEDAERTLWDALESGKYFVINKHLVSKDLGRKTVFCIKSFSNNEGYVLLEGAFYGFVQKQDKANLYFQYNNGVKLINTDNLEIRMLRTIIPYKGLSETRQIEEIRKYINEKIED